MIAAFEILIDGVQAIIVGYYCTSSGSTSIFCSPHVHFFICVQQRIAKKKGFLSVFVDRDFILGNAEQVIENGLFLMV